MWSTPKTHVAINIKTNRITSSQSRLEVEGTPKLSKRSEVKQQMWMAERKVGFSLKDVGSSTTVPRRRMKRARKEKWLVRSWQKEMGRQ